LLADFRAITDGESGYGSFQAKFNLPIHTKNCVTKRLHEIGAPSIVHCSSKYSAVNSDKKKHSS